MGYVGIIFEFVTYIILEALTVQNIHMLSNCKIKNKAVAFITICLFSAINSFMYEIGKIPKVFAVLILAYLLVNRLLLYIVVFKKINLKLIYVFLIARSTNQIYYNISKTIFSDNNIILSVAYIMESIVLILAMIYISKNNKMELYRQIAESLPRRLYVLILILLLIASVFVMVATRKWMAGFITYLLLPSMIGLVLSTIAILKMGISETEKKSNVDLLSRQVESQVAYYEKINKIYSEFRSFRHDYKNHVLCLRGLIAADKKEEALEYMNTMQDMSSVGKNKYNTGNVIIDALLDDKSEKAEKVNIKLVFDGIVPTSGISNADLCVIMANAIDNAIEACSKDVSGNENSIKVDADFRQGYFFLRVSNPMFEEVKFKGKNKVATSKADKEHHGFGVANIVRTAEKYGGTADISTNNGEFTIDIQLLLEQSQEEKAVCTAT